MLLEATVLMKHSRSCQMAKNLKKHLRRVLLAVVLGSVDHVDQSGLGLLPLTGLETAVRVDPELLRLEVGQHLSDAVLDLLLRGNTGGVDVVDTGANVAGVGLVLEDLEELGVALAVLDGQNVSIEGGNGVEEVLELRVTEVGVDLGGVLDTRAGELEGIDSPGQVLLALGAGTEGKTLTEGRLVDLNDVDASSLEVNDLIAESESKLLSLDGLVDVVTREGPSEAGDGTCEHTLHGLLGDGGSVLGLLDGHGSRTGDVTDDDGRSDAAGAVGLDPALGGEDITVKALTEVLHHVVALRLAVDVDVKAKLILDLDDLLNLLLDEPLVLLSSDVTLGELVALDTDLLGLREGTDGGGGESGQAEVLLLLSVTRRELRLALVLLRGNAGLTVLDSLVVGALGRGTSLHGLGVGLEGLADGSRALADSLGNDNNLGDLLDGEREPVLDLGGQLLLALEGVRSVKKRAGSGNNDTVFAELLDGRLNKLNGVLEVGLPDVAAVDNTSREGLVGAELADNSVKLLGVPDEVDVDSSNVLDAGEDIEVVNDVTEVCGEDKLGQTAASELLVGGLESILDLLLKVVDEAGLVDLDVLGTSLLQLLEELDVYGKELLEKGDGVDRLVTVGLTEGKEGDGTDKDGAGNNASLLSLEELADRLGVGSELERLAILEGRLDVVVVGVKPLDHFLGRG
jgi:hypothetical protein